MPDNNSWHMHSNDTPSQDRCKRKMFMPQVYQTAEATVKRDSR